MADIVERITAYLSGGGLFNPELAHHDAVRDMIIDCRTEITALRAEIERLTKTSEAAKENRDSLLKAMIAKDAEVQDIKDVFDRRWKADQRAIKRWQEAHPGNDLVWPDRADMVVWLLEEVATLNLALTMATDDVNKAHDRNERLRAALETHQQGPNLFWRGYAEQMNEEQMALHAENERLRAALHKIEQKLTGDLSTPVVAVSLPQIRSIARAALTKENET